jgi:hypothetical protein
VLEVVVADGVAALLGIDVTVVVVVVDAPGVLVEEEFVGADDVEVWVLVFGAAEPCWWWRGPTAGT